MLEQVKFINVKRASASPERFNHLCSRRKKGSGKSIRRFFRIQPIGKTVVQNQVAQLVSEPEALAVAWPHMTDHQDKAPYP